MPNEDIAVAESHRSLVQQERQGASVPGFAADGTRKFRTILLFGAPGSGKGTVGKCLGAIPGFVHCACGDVFRNLDLSSEIGQSFIRYSAKGLLVPDDATISLWKDSINGLVAIHRFVPSRDYLVLDGIPRSLEQAKIIADYVDVVRIFYLVCSNEELMFDRLRRRALKENRLDDASDEVIRRRWQIYEEESRPVLEYYPSEIIEQVDAVGSPVKVISDILTRILAANLA